MITKYMSGRIIWIIYSSIILRDYSYILILRMPKYYCDHDH